MLLAGNNAAMVTCYIKIMTATRLPMIGNMYDTGIVTSLVNKQLKIQSIAVRKVLETVASLLN